jgi:hypothetical protein
VAVSVAVGELAVRVGTTGVVPAVAGTDGEPATAVGTTGVVPAVAGAVGTGGAAGIVDGSVAESGVNEGDGDDIGAIVGRTVAGDGVSIAAGALVTPSQAMLPASLWVQPSLKQSRAMAAVLRKGILQETRLPVWRALASREKRLALETGVQSAL